MSTQLGAIPYIIGNCPCGLLNLVENLTKLGVSVRKIRAVNLFNTLNCYFWNLDLWTFLGREGRGLRETSTGRFWLQNRFVSLPLYFKLIALDSYPHPASNHSIFQKKNVQSLFLVLYSKESVRNRQWTSPFFSWSLVCVRLLFSFPPSCQGLRTGVLYDSG